MKIVIIRGPGRTVRRGLEASGLRACWAPFRQTKFLFSIFLSLTSFYPLIVGEGYCCTWSYSVTRARARLDSADRGIDPSQRPYVAKHIIPDGIRTRNPHTHTHTHTRLDSSGRRIDPSQRSLRDKTQTGFEPATPASGLRAHQL